MSSEFHRFNPAEETSADYLALLPADWRLRNLGRSLVLSSVYTPLAESLYIDVTAGTQNGVPPIPEELSGAEPMRERIRDKVAVDIDGIALWSNADEYGNRYRYESDDHGDVGDLLTIRTPVGRYGERFAWAVTQATRAMYSVAIDKLTPETQELNSEHKKVAGKLTFFADSLHTILDSINSVGQSFYVLTNAQNFPGYENDPVGRFRELIKTKTFNAMAHIVPLGEVASNNRMGLSYLEAIDPSSLAFRKEFREAMLRYRGNFESRNRSRSPRQTFAGCPVARENTLTERDGELHVVKPSGINLVAEAFAAYLDYYFNGVGTEGFEPPTSSM